MAFSAEDQLLGRIALHYKLVTQEQLNRAMAESNGQPLDQFLLAQKIITPEQRAWLLNAQQTVAKQQGGAARPSAPAAQPQAQPPAPQQAQPRPSMPQPQPQPVGQPEKPVPTAAAGALEMRTVLKRSFAVRASDVHIHAGAPIQLRVSGALKELKTGALTPLQTEQMLLPLLSAEQREQLDKDWELDLALQLEEGRFRVNIYRQQRGLDAVFRPISPEPPTLEQLGLPPTLKRLTDYHQGLVLLTGPAGSGKSSTLAALVNLVNEARHDHIITVEDPIEYVHPSKGCVVNQRQANKHTKSFANALRAALREDPDVIVIGELRDLETISLAITAAETGHLVMGTLHTNNAVRTINRILDAFPPKQQSQIRAMVSESLRAIVSQRLLPSADGTRRVAAVETLFVKPAVSNLIREEKTFQIRSIMQTGRNEGTILLDDALMDLVKSGQISQESARRAAEDPKRFGAPPEPAAAAPGQPMARPSAPRGGR